MIIERAVSYTHLDVYKRQEKANALYSFVRLEDIEALNAQAALTREKIIAADGAANYIRPFLNALDEEEFDMFVPVSYTHLDVYKRQLQARS